MALGDPLDQIKARKNYYRDRYRASLKVLLFFALLAIGLGGAIYYAYSHQRLETFYASSSNGNIWPLTPSDAPPGVLGGGEMLQQ